MAMPSALSRSRNASIRSGLSSAIRMRGWTAQSEVMIRDTDFQAPCHGGDPRFSPESPGYLALTRSVARHAGPEVVDLLGAYFGVGEPDLLTGLFAAAGLHIDRFETWLGATRLDSIDTFLAVELLPLADRVDQAVREKIIADCRTTLAPFTGLTGAIAAPIEVHLITAHR